MYSAHLIVSLQTENRTMRKAMRFTLLLVLTLLACTGHRYPTQLVVADSLCAVNPDSALHLLKQYKDSIQTASTADRMYYELLTVKASDKADKLQPDAEHILSLVDYYEHNGDKDLLPTAYYYAGRTYCELRDEPTALKYFLFAEQTARYTDDLISRIYSQIGYLYYHQNIRSKSLEYHHKSLKSSRVAKDTVSTIMALCDIAYIHQMNEDKDSSILFLKEAERLSSDSKNNRRLNDIRYQLASLYSDQGKNGQALGVMRTALCDTTYKIDGAVLATISKIYYNAGLFDTAEYYINQVLRYGNIYGKRASHKRLADIFMHRGELNKISEQLLAYETCEDSIQRQTESVALTMANASFNYHSKEEENMKLRMQNTRIIFIYVISGLLLLFISGWVISRLYRSKKMMEMKKNRYKSLQMQIFARSKEQLLKNSNEIENLKNKIAQLDSSVNRKGQELDKRRRLECEKEILEQENVVSIQNEDLRHRKEDMMESTTIYKIVQIIRNDSNKNLQMTEARWQELHNEVNNIYKGFYETLYCQYRLKEQAYRMCLLMKIKIPTSDIARILHVEKSAISNRKKFLSQKFFGRDGNARMWTDYIDSI